ncbi:excinuclease ABC subunit UvrC [Candidatus Gracilibacteria bacterium]|nr:excinuclease ABC subunit UvrC [Candidatus Gracilibacteria bacterium]
MKKEKKAFSFQPKSIPSSSGCYLFWDQNDHLLYVGKAKNIRKRVSSYFQSSKKEVHEGVTRTEIMTSKIARIETRVTQSETEALILENNLVKDLHPRFNVRLKDDKNFVYLRITHEDFPKMEITRRIVRDGSVYIGPKTSVKEFRATVRFCQKFFRVRMVKSSLDYYPLVVTGGLESGQAEYNRQVDLMKQFLRGRTEDVLRVLKERMMRFATDKNFEAAARTRDTIASIETSTQKQIVQFSDTKDRDFIDFVREGSSAYCIRIAFRNGKLLDQNELEFAAPEFSNDAEIIEGFLLQFYEHVVEKPEEIYIPSEIEEKQKIEILLSVGTRHGVSLQVPQRGDKKNILDMARKNAAHFAERKKIEALSHAENFAKALPELSQILKLSAPPRRIECFDISHFSGTATVASQVVFLDGEPKTSQYRRFHVRTLEDGKIDDFAALKEVLSRRFARLASSPLKKEKLEEGEKKKKKQQNLVENIPDLIVIDGGKGQLSSVMKAVGECRKGKKFPPSFKPSKQIIALAKREELIFRPGKKDHLEISLDSPALKLLQRIRDEAHRFAITFNRSVRKKTATTSILDSIPGIGNATRKKLIQHFGSVGGVTEASDKDLRKILSPTQLKNLRKSI